jgi:DNA-binding NtrC family response regulator
MVMPGQVTGLELAQRLREEKADLRVMISSGYSAEPAPSPSVAQQQITCLAKPHKVVTLAKVVRQCLDDQPGAPRQSDP